MKLITKLGCAAVAAAAFWTAGVSAQGYFLDGSIIDYRQQIMRAQDANAAAIGMILTGTVPNENMLTHFEALLLSNRQARDIFEMEIEGGNAKPEIWENWDDFAGKLDTAEENLKLAIEEIKANGPGAAGEVAIAALACKDCHDVYKVTE